MALTRLWAGMRTRDTDDAGTDDSPIVLIINADGHHDLLHHTFEENTPQEDQERGKANLYEVADVEPLGITPVTLQPSSVRVGIRGGDAWAPEDVFVFGEENGSPIPLALARDITEVLSTQLSDGGGDARLSIPIPPVSLGTPTTEIFRLLVLMVTGPQGTDGTVALRIFTPANGTQLPVVDFRMPTAAGEDGGSQDHQEATEANFYYAEPFTPFRKSIISSITLSLEGDDDWRPASFFLFGLDRGVREPGSPLAIVPLVYLPEWTLGTLAAKPGAPDPAPDPVVLPLV